MPREKTGRENRVRAAGRRSEVGGQRPWLAAVLQNGRPGVTRTLPPPQRGPLRFSPPLSRYQIKPAFELPQTPASGSLSPAVLCSLLQAGFPRVATRWRPPQFGALTGGCVCFGPTGPYFQEPLQWKVTEDCQVLLTCKASPCPTSSLRLVLLAALPTPRPKFHPQCLLISHLGSSSRSLQRHPGRPGRL